MRNSLTCTKCKSKNIKKTRGLPVQLDKKFFPVLIHFDYYICCNCGFSETYAHNQDDLDKLKSS